MSKPKLICDCGKEVELELQPRKYEHDHEWWGKCSCGRDWVLVDTIPILAEAD